MFSDEPDTEEEEDDEDDGQETIGGEFNEEPGNDSGCTAVVALLRGRDLFVANAGDSRCVICRDGKVGFEILFVCGCRSIKDTFTSFSIFFVDL